MEEKNNYKKALDYIYSFIDFSLTRNLRYTPDKFDLSRMYSLMEILGNPQYDYDVVHVAGTKGKGSTCAMIASILLEAGYSVGFYSSPHMIDFRERIRINNELITQQSLIHELEKAKPAIEKIENISTFEIITAIAFQSFSTMNVDIAIIEVGMGGRLDATNVVDPILSVITPISLDHTKILGNTISKIAQEKAGIIKEAVPVVISGQTEQAKKVIQSIAKEKESRLIEATKNVYSKQVSFSLDGQTFNIHKRNSKGSRASSLNISLPLLGDHQITNALTAFTCINQLENSGYSIASRAVCAGLAQVEWPGRFEVIHHDPLVIIDGAHNTDSFKKLTHTLNKYIPSMKKILVFGVSEDKNAVSMLKCIKESVDHIILTKSNHPRAENINKLEKISLDLGIKSYSTNSIEEIVIKIRKKENPTYAYICTGSIFVAGAIKQMLIEEG